MRMQALVACAMRAGHMHGFWVCASGACGVCGALHTVSSRAEGDERLPAGEENECRFAQLAHARAQCARRSARGASAAGAHPEAD